VVGAERGALDAVRGRRDPGGVGQGSFVERHPPRN
jgi:hypothetical protein